MCRYPRQATPGCEQCVYRTSLMKLCIFVILMASSVTDPIAFLSHGQLCVNTTVHQCEPFNSRFEKSLNHIHYMVLAAGQTTNEVYTFKDMLKQDNPVDFTKAMDRKKTAHKKRKQWEFFMIFSAHRQTNIFKHTGLPSGRQVVPCCLLNKHKAGLGLHVGL